MFPNHGYLVLTRKTILIYLSSDQNENGLQSIWWWSLTPLFSNPCQLSYDWDQTLCIDSNDIDKSFKNFPHKFNSLLYLYAPYKKLSKHLGKTMDYI